MLTWKLACSKPWQGKYSFPLSMIILYLILETKYVGIFRRFLQKWLHPRRPCGCPEEWMYVPFLHPPPKAHHEKKHTSQRLAQISQIVVAKSSMQISKLMHSHRHSPSFIFRFLFVKLSMWAHLLTDSTGTFGAYRCYLGIRCEGPAFFPLRQKRCCK